MVNHFGVKKVDLEIHTLEWLPPTVSNSKLSGNVSPGIEPWIKMYLQNKLLKEHSSEKMVS